MEEVGLRLVEGTWKMRVQFGAYIFVFEVLTGHWVDRNTKQL